MQLTAMLNVDMLMDVGDGDKMMAGGNGNNIQKGNSMKKWTKLKNRNMCIFTGN